MWICKRCGKPVYFGEFKNEPFLEIVCPDSLTVLQQFLAERRQSIGFDWHRQCLRCEECGKVLHPGQHAEVNKLMNVSPM